MEELRPSLHRVVTVTLLGKEKKKKMQESSQTSDPQGLRFEM